MKKEHTQGKQYNFTWSATAYKSAMIHGRQQQTAIPMTHASATQNTTKNTSKPKKIIHSLHTTSYYPM